MTGKSIRQRMIRFTCALAIGGTAFQLSGCDPQVRSTLLLGLETTTQSLTGALITAFFQTLDDDATTGATGLTTT